MRTQIHSVVTATLYLTSAVHAYSLVPRQSNTTAPQTIDLNGPQITYEGPWENVTSPCNLGSIARKSDNSRADDVKATITFANDVKAFTLSVQAQSNNVNYTIETEGIVKQYNALNNPTTAVGQTGCPILLTHNFGSGSKVVTISLRMLRSAKRDLLVERQAFELPWVQINEVKALFTTATTPDNGDNQAGNETLSPSASKPGGGLSRFSNQCTTLAIASALVMYVLV